MCVECLIGKQKKPILFKVTEPSHGASAVARVSDRGRVAEVEPIYRNVSELSIRVSPSHSYNATRAGLGPGLEGMCVLHAVVVLWVCL